MNSTASSSAGWAHPITPLTRPIWSFRALSIPVMWVNAAELIHYLPGLIGPHSLLWLNSQSGRSAELVHLLKLVAGLSGRLCAFECE